MCVSPLAKFRVPKLRPEEKNGCDCGASSTSEKFPHSLSGQRSAKDFVKFLNFRFRASSLKQKAERQF